MFRGIIRGFRFGLSGVWGSPKARRPRLLTATGGPRKVIEEIRRQMEDGRVKDGRQAIDQLEPSITIIRDNRLFNRSIDLSSLHA
jgi:hypothetical protein